ncbi:MAG: YncE family protein [Planctomycetota bacterium]|jgi:YVTN family beta-propeller protein
MNKTVFRNGLITFLVILAILVSANLPSCGSSKKDKHYPYEIGTGTGTSTGTGSGTGTGTEPPRFAYALLPDSGRLSVIDRTRLSLVWSVYIGGRPIEITALRNGGIFYLTSPSTGALSVFDTARNIFLTNVEGESFSSRACGLPAADKAYILAENGNRLAVLDTESHQVMTSIQLPAPGNDLALLDDANWVFCALPQQGTVAVVETDHVRIVDTFLAGLSSEISVQPSSSDFYFAGSWNSSSVDIISISRLGVINRLGLSAPPAAALTALCENTSRVYFAPKDRKLVTIVDTERLMIMADISCPFEPKVIEAGGIPTKIVFGSADGHVLFLDPKSLKFFLNPIKVTSQTPILRAVPGTNFMFAVDGNGTVFRLNLEHMIIEASLAVPAPAGEDSVVVDSWYGKLYIGSDAGTLTIIDVETFKVLTEIYLGSQPLKIVLATYQ